MILLLDAGMVLWALLDGQSIGPLKEMPAVVRMRAMPVASAYLCRSSTLSGA